MGRLGRFGEVAVRRVFDGAQFFIYLLERICGQVGVYWGSFRFGDRFFEIRF